MEKNSTLKKIFDKIHKVYFQYRLRKAGPQGRADILRKYFYHIGENVELFTMEFGTEPYLINIEDNVVVASGVRFVTHDVSCFIIARYLNVPRESLDKVGSITLHENCFIGAYSTLMLGCSVGKNSIIAAGSVVTKNVPDGEVWGGVPAKFIMTTEEYSKRLLKLNDTYPWMKDRNSFSKEDLISIRQDYFFNSQKKS